MVGPLQPSERSVKPRRADEAMDAIVDAVLEGHFPPGTSLPAERELASRLGISRSSLREAITRLEQLGVVDSQQGRGTIVLDLEASTDPNLVARLVEQHGDDVMAELFEVREAMGVLVGRLAAQRATVADLRLLDSALDVVRGAQDAAQRQRAEFAFFADLVAAAHNRPLRTMLRWTEQAYGPVESSFVEAFEDATPILDALTVILAAVKAGDVASAEEAMGNYASASAARMLRALTRHQAD
jgi:GntR family transcriptional regulator, transcriptional repressor for pyruvate dehydrogenase complex